MIRLGVIGYGVRADMLMDELLTLPGEACLCAVADQNPERVKALMTKKAVKNSSMPWKLIRLTGCCASVP